MILIIIIVVIVTGGKQSQILLCRLRTILDNFMLPAVPADVEDKCHSYHSNVAFQGFTFFLFLILSEAIRYGSQRSLFRLLVSILKEKSY